MYPFFSHLPVTVLLDRTEANSRFRNHLISLNDLVQFDLPYRNEAVDRRMKMAAERYAGDFYEYSQPHIHERMEILYVLEGNGIVMANETFFPTGRGEAVLLNPHEPHALFCSGKDVFQRAVISFPISYLRQITMYDHIDAMCRSGRKFRNDLGSDTAVTACLDAILSAAEKRLPGFEYEILGEICRIIAHLFAADRITDADIITAQELQFRETVEKQIVAHFREEYTCAAAAAEMNYSREHFCRLFRAYYHTTFTKYLNSFRIQHAKLSLRMDPTQSITQLAAGLGFNDSGYFTRVFRQMTGVTPRVYGKQVAEREQ